MKTKKIHGKNKPIANALNNRLIIFILVFALIGVSVLLYARAASPYLSVQPETSTITSPAISINDAAASGGKAVQFKAAVAASGYPNDSNTGYKPLLASCPNGVLKVYSNSQYYASDLGVSNGGTLSCVEIHGRLDINVSNLTISKSWIWGEVGVNTNSSTWNPTIQDTEIGGALGTRWGDTATGSWSYTLLRDNIHGFGDGPRVNGDVLLQDNYIHDEFIQAGDHNDAVQITQGSNVRILHNTLYLNNNETSCIQTGADQGNISNLTISNNLVAGGGYSIYGGGTPPAGASVTNVTITNNQVSTIYYPNGGFYGAFIHVTPDATFSNNTWYDGPNKGQTLPRPAP